MPNDEQQGQLVTAVFRQQGLEGADDQKGTDDQNGTLELRVAELDLRLRERIEESLVLDAEVRSLQAELDVRQGFVAELERQVTALSMAHHEFASLQAELNRAGHRIVCGVYQRAARFPRAYRATRVLCRAIARWSVRV